MVHGFPCLIITSDKKSSTKLFVCCLVVRRTPRHGWNAARGVQSSFLAMPPELGRPTPCSRSRSRYAPSSQEYRSLVCGLSCVRHTNLLDVALITPYATARDQIVIYRDNRAASLRSFQPTGSVPRDGCSCSTPSLEINDRTESIDKPETSPLIPNKDPWPGG